MARRRVTLTLPQDLWDKLHALVPPRKISQFIEQAAEDRLAAEKRARLRELIKEQCLAREAQDIAVARDFFDAEREAEARLDP